MSVEAPLRSRLVHLTGKALAKLHTRTAFESVAIREICSVTGWTPVTVF
jgi:hypothetical protein